MSFRKILFNLLTHTIFILINAQQALPFRSPKYDVCQNKYGYISVLKPISSTKYKMHWLNRNIIDDRIFLSGVLLTHWIFWQNSAPSETRQGDTRSEVSWCYTRSEVTLMLSNTEKAILWGWWSVKTQTRQLSFPTTWLLCLRHQELHPTWKHPCWLQE